MPEVRRLVYVLRDQGACEVVQKGEVVDTCRKEGDLSGPIRVRRSGGGEGEGEREREREREGE